MAYNRYTNTYIPWVRQIPSHWTIKRSKSLFSNKKELNKGGQCNNVLSLTLKGVINNDIDNPVGLVPKDYSTYQIFDKNNLVFKLIDLENTQTSRVGLVHEHGIMSPAYIRLIPQSQINIKYFYYQYYDLYLRQIFNQLGAGVRATLGVKELLNVELVVPPLTEQNHIVRFIDWKLLQIAKLIKVKKKQKVLLNQQKQLLINNTVTKGLQPEALLKSSGVSWIGSIPNHWEIVPLKRCAIIHTGITLGKQYPSGTQLVEMPYLRVANVQNGFVDISDIATIHVTPHEAERYRLRKGAVLMTEGGDRDKLGRGCVWDGNVDPCLHQNHIFAVEVDESKLNGYYLEYLTISNIGREYFDLTAIRTTNLACTNSSKVMAFPIPLPPIDEQNEIVDYLKGISNKFDHVISKINYTISCLEEYRTRLISDVVTGQIDVRDIQIPENITTLKDLESTITYDTDIDEETEGIM